jgi:2-isopropylmalate synthase
LKDAQTYEIIAPEEVGADTSKIVLTARSGRSALAYRFKKLGFDYNRNEVDSLYEAFLKIADELKEVNDNNLLDLANVFQSSTVTA